MASLEKVHDLLQQEVSRKEFLRYAGVAVLSIIGVTGMLQNIRAVQPQQKQGSGYGMSSYGR